jgi:SAM-dependent methyltransferase
MSLKIGQMEPVIARQLEKQYEIEKSLANRLRSASGEERMRLYSVIYDEFYRWMRCNPRQNIDEAPKIEREVLRQIRFLRPYLNSNVVFAEIGPGDCALSFEVAKFVKAVYAVEASKEIGKQQHYRENFTLVISDGRSIPLQRHSVHIVYSHQFIEHLHPDDAVEHIRNVYEILAPGGVYICLTPNRLNGPHDISRYFDLVAAGLHLKEYNKAELANIFTTAGFRNIRAYYGAKGFFVSLSTSLVAILEEAFAHLPLSMRKGLGNSLPLRLFLGIRLVGQKLGGSSE